MLGLGSNIVSKPVIGKSIVRDGLVLKHDYSGGPVDLCSTGAAIFDESNDQIDIGNVFTFGTEDFSITAWVKWDVASTAGGESYIISKIVDANNTIKLAYKTSVNKFVFTTKENGNSIVGNGTVTGITSAMENEWIHVTVTCDRDGKTKIYVNGSTDIYGLSVDSLSSSEDIDSSGGWVIGGQESSTFGNFEGLICNVGVWKGEVLSQPQIKSIMQKDYAGLSDSEKTNLVSWWNLDSVIPGSTTLVYDNHYGGGEVLGAEEVTNGDFATNLSGWGLAGINATNTITWETNGVRIISTNANIAIQQNALIVGKTYRLTCDVAITFGKIGLDGISIANQDSISFVEGFNEITFVAASVTLKIKRTVANSNCLLDNVSVKEVQGNTGKLS